MSVTVVLSAPSPLYETEEGRWGVGLGCPSIFGGLGTYVLCSQSQGLFIVLVPFLVSRCRRPGLVVGSYLNSNFGIGVKRHHERFTSPTAVFMKTFTVRGPMGNNNREQIFLFPPNFYGQ